MDTRKIKIGSVAIGGGNPIAIQSMTNTDTRNVDATVAQIQALTVAGCEIVRASVYDEECARAFRVIKDRIDIPLVADIHFNNRLAILAIENGADKLRINPGNIGGPDKVKSIVDCARTHHVPIRIGVNGGSLSRDIRDEMGVGPDALCESMLRTVRMMEAMGFNDLVLAAKSSNVPVMVATNRKLSEMFDYPLHLGVTEAGTEGPGTVKSAVGIGALLLDEIGDTVRVSLTGDPVKEIDAARSILSAAGKRRFGVEVISCPTCGRTCIDVAAIAREVEQRTRDMGKPIKIAVMGCVVNGPGEAREADIGVAGGREFSLIFSKGKKERKIVSDRLADELLREIGEQYGSNR